VPVTIAFRFWRVLLHKSIPELSAEDRGVLRKQKRGWSLVQWVRFLLLIADLVTYWRFP